MSCLYHNKCSQMCSRHKLRLEELSGGNFALLEKMPEAAKRPQDAILYRLSSTMLGMYICNETFVFSLLLST